MIKVKRLSNESQIFDIKTGEVFLIRKSRNNNSFYLNNNIKVEQVTGQVKKDTFPGKVIKIKPPFSVEVEYLDGPYEIEEENVNLGGISDKMVGKKFNINVKIDSVQVTSGPTVFKLTDGTGTIKSTAFNKGQRAYPELNIGDIIRAKITVTEYDGNIECSLDSYTMLEDHECQKILKHLELIHLEKAKPKQDKFLVKSDVLEKLREKIIDVAAVIRQAIFENRPIVIRHHADCDGYCGAMALERAILPLILEQHKTDKSEYQYYRRAPSKAPFYEFIDVIKDITYATEDKAKFGQKEPLIILIDNGSTQEDVLSIKKIKMYNAKVVVIDHHSPGEVIDGSVEVDKYVDAHVNPYLVGGNSKIVAGMLGVEVARFINENVSNIEFLAAIAGFGDRSDGVEMEQYVEIARRFDYTDEFMKDVAEVIDYEAHFLKFMESRHIVADILGLNKEKQKEIVGLLITEAKRRREIQLEVVKKYNKVTEFGKRILVEFEMEEITNRGEYPAVGKSAGIGHDHFKTVYPSKEIITFGFGPDFLTIRATEKSGFDVNKLVKILQEKMPYGMIDGGGHECAGSIKFIGAAKQELREKVVEHVKNMD